MDRCLEHGEAYRGDEEHKLREAKLGRAVPIHEVKHALHFLLGALAFKENVEGHVVEWNHF